MAKEGGRFGGIVENLRGMTRGEIHERQYPQIERLIEEFLGMRPLAPPAQDKGQGKGRDEGRNKGDPRRVVGRRKQTGPFPLGSRHAYGILGSSRHLPWRHGQDGLLRNRPGRPPHPGRDVSRKKPGLPVQRRGPGRPPRPPGPPAPPRRPAGPASQGVHPQAS